MSKKTNDGKHNLEQNISSSRFAIPLRRKVDIDMIQHHKDSWFNAIEDVVQLTMQNLRKRTINNLYLSGVRDLESTLFSKSLISVRSNWHQRYEGKSIPPELEIFSNPVGLVTFQVHNRKYSCIKYPVEEEKEENVITSGFEASIRALEKVFSSNRIDIKIEPTTKELVSILIDHLSEDLGKDDSQFYKISNYIVGEMLRPRRSAIRDWQDRFEQHITEKYDHEDDEFFFYTYPIVDLLIEDGKYLSLLFVSPLDKNFVDEKVSVYHQCAEITLAIFDVENINFSRYLEPIANHLKQAYGRVLFTNMHEEASRALIDTFDDQSRILRHWVKMAARGYDGLIKNDISKGIFDSDDFIQGIVKEVLCADIPNVDTEIYPFDRVLIFREAGSSSSKSINEPIEVTVMETSILSTNPADRNQYLTAPEMRIRTTEDFERDASSKIVKDQDILKFYLHSHGNEIIFSRKSKLTKADIERIDTPQASSLSEESSIQRFFKLIPPKDDWDNEIEDMFSNLLGRLLAGNFTQKATYSPKTGQQLFMTETFNKDFEKKRLDATEKFDARGLYYNYNHGLHLKVEVPLLHQLQEAYFAFLEEIFKERNIHHVRDRYRQDNLDKEQMRTVLEEHKDVERENRRKYIEGNLEEDSTDTKQASKVVYIAFSWELHDENMDILRGIQPTGINDDDDTLSERALLGEEYTYTVILISDIDREKSLSQLNAERENLKLFFQLIMDRIWIDKKFEFERLNNRSKMIVGSLTQFAHRAKSFISNEEHENYLDQEMDKLKAFTNAKGTTAKLIEFNDPSIFFAQLLQTPEKLKLSPSEVETNLRSWLKAVFTNAPRDVDQLILNIQYSHIPDLKIRWSRSIVKEAFDNVIKNACEAALDENKKDGVPTVTIQLQAIPRFSYSSGHWFFDVVVENTGGPIPNARLNLLNSSNPKPLGESEKEGSTGIGIYLSRFQLINDIGGGANLIYTNLDNGNVQVRLRLPATLIESVESDQIVSKRREIIKKDYILYVEDHPVRYKEALSDLRSALLGTSIDIRHRKSLFGAMATVNSKMPLAIFTDFNIFPQEEGGDNASPKYGRELLEGILVKAKGMEKPPPIWIMTEEKESEILIGLKDEQIDLIEFGYSLVPETEKDTMNFIQPGAFVVFSGEKNPTKIPGFDKIIANLIKLDTVQKETFDSRPQSANVIHFDFSTGGLKDLEKEYQDLMESTPNGILFGQKIISNADELYTSLRTWFLGPKLPDLDFSASLGMIKQKPIRSHYNHDKIILNLEADLSLYKQIPVELIYWGLSQNILISPEGFGLNKAVRGWRNIQHDDKGPLSKFRHDMKNEFHDVKFDKVRVELQSEIDKAESILKSETYDFQLLDECLTSKKANAEEVLSFLADPKLVDETRNRLSSIFYNIAGILGHLKEQSNSPNFVIDKFKDLRYHLGQFLGVR